MKITPRLLFVAALATSFFGASAAVAQNQPGPDRNHQDRTDNRDMQRDHRAMRNDRHDMRMNHVDRRDHRNWHRHCTWKWRHHHRVRVCW